MTALPADAIVDIVFGILNVMLTLVVIWQTHKNRERHHQLRLSVTPTMLLVLTEDDEMTSRRINREEALCKVFRNNDQTGKLQEGTSNREACV